MSDWSSDIEVAIVRPASINWFDPPPPGGPASPTSETIWTPTMVPLATQPSSGPSAAAQYAAQIRASPPKPTPAPQQEDHVLACNALLVLPIYPVDSLNPPYQPLRCRTRSNSSSPILGHNPYTPPMPEGEWFASRLETPPSSPAKSISEKIRSLFRGVTKRARRLSKSVKRSPRARAVRTQSGPMKMLETEISLVDLVATNPAPDPAVLTDDIPAQGGEIAVDAPDVDVNTPAPAPASFADDIAAQNDEASVGAHDVNVIESTPGPTVLAVDSAAQGGSVAADAHSDDVDKPLPAGPADTDKSLPQTPAPPSPCPPPGAETETPAPVSRVPSWSHSEISSWRAGAAYAYPTAMAPAPAPPSVDDEESLATSDVPDLVSDEQVDSADDGP